MTTIGLLLKQFNTLDQLTILMRADANVYRCGRYYMGPITEDEAAELTAGLRPVTT